STCAVLERSLIGIRDVVNNALADVRLTAGISRSETISIREFIAEVEIGALMEARARNLRLTVPTIDPGVAVETDRQILGSVVSNFVQNALKFTRPGGRV